MGRLSIGQGFRMLQSLILIDAVSLLDGRRREGKRKKKDREEQPGGWGFPKARPTLSVLQAAAVRCN
jgi:hypothetical protein